MRFGSPPKLAAFLWTQATARRTCSAIGIRLPPALITSMKSGTTKCAPACHEQLGRVTELPGLAGAPRAAVDEHVDRRVRPLGRVDVEHLDRGRTVGHAPGLTEARAHLLAFRLPPLVKLRGIRRIDRLVVGVVELLLIHVRARPADLFRGRQARAAPKPLRSRSALRPPAACDKTFRRVGDSSCFVIGPSLQSAPKASSAPAPRGPATRMGSRTSQAFQSDCRPRPPGA